MSDLDYKKTLESYRTDELHEITRTINRTRFPERYALLLQEIDSRQRAESGVSLRGAVRFCSEPTSLSRRFFAQLLDGVIAIFLMFVSFFFMLMLLGKNNSISVRIALVTWLSYLLFSDGFQNGQSYGKRVFKIAVVDQATKQPCTFLQSLIRNLSLLVLGIFDVVLAFVPPYNILRQRLGDVLANTIVVELGEARDLF